MHSAYGPVLAHLTTRVRNAQNLLAGLGRPRFCGAGRASAALGECRNARVARLCAL